MTISLAARKAFREAIDTNEIAEHMEEYNGLCLACGQWQYGECEPDAREYECESCGKRAVYGAEECLIMIGG
jgi:hypothetical protein